MRARRGRPPDAPIGSLLNGPAKLCQAFSISLTDNGHSLLTGDIALHLPQWGDLPLSVGVSTRIGLSRGAALPYRFFALDNPFGRSREGHLLDRAAGRARLFGRRIEQAWDSRHQVFENVVDQVNRLANAVQRLLLLVEP